MAHPPYHFKVTIRYDRHGIWDVDWERRTYTHTGELTFLLDRYGPGPRAYPVPIRIPMILVIPFPPHLRILGPLGPLPPYPDVDVPPLVHPPVFVQPLHPYVPPVVPPRQRTARITVRPPAPPLQLPPIVDLTSSSSSSHSRPAYSVHTTSSSSCGTSSSRVRQRPYFERGEPSTRRRLG